MDEKEYTWTNAMFQQTVSYWRSRADARAEGANQERSLHWMQADAEVQRLRAALDEALDPNTEWTSSTWARLLAIRDGDYRGHDAAGSDQ